MKLLAYHDPLLIEAGCDEAGRGCLAGPVFAAAVILPKDFDDDILNDSKQMTAKRRKSMREEIESRALAWGVGQANIDEITDLNIANASYLAMNRAIENMQIKPELLLIDGKYFKTESAIHSICIVKGDSKYAAIAAASVLAKTHRDAYMQQLAEGYPEYEWHINKGYPTIKHRQAIMDFGITEHHRKSFKLLPEIKLFDEKPLKKKRRTIK